MIVMKVNSEYNENHAEESRYVRSLAYEFRLNIIYDFIHKITITNYI